MTPHCRLSKERERSKERFFFCPKMHHGIWFLLKKPINK